MLVVRGIGAGVAHYFLDGRDPGCWTPGAARLLGLSGPVRSGDLRAVLSGIDPHTGRFLPRVRHPRRRGGWDLVFSAPKSLSLLAAGSPAGDSVTGAHAAAVGRVLEHVEQRLTVRDAVAPGGAGPAGGLVAARFEHASNAASEPHVHTHVLVANLTRTDRGWSAVSNSEWYVGRARLGALYQMALRHELRQRGWDLEWRLRPDGLADLAGVPSPAVRAASTQGRQAAAQGRFVARRGATPQPWQDRVVRAGFDRRTRGEVGRGPDPGRGGEDRAGVTARGGLGPGEAELERRVASRLAMRRSDFREADVIVALAATVEHGCPPDRAASWAERFCAASQPAASPTAGPRWTTSLARRADDRLVDLLEGMRATPGPPGPGPTGGRGGGPPASAVSFLSSLPGRSDLVAQAEYLEGCRAGWDRDGLRAAVLTPAASAARWEVLTGLPAHRPGTAADVLVVDQADRRSTPELLQLLEAARARGSWLIMVEGGTLPRLAHFASRGLAEFSAGTGALTCPPPPEWTPAPTPADERGPGRWGRRAADELLGRWCDGDRSELLVGLGLEEVRSLNRAARLVEAGARAGPAVRSGRGETFAAGDRVVVVRSGPRRPPYGTFGRIADVGDTGRSLGIRWDGQDRAVAYGPEIAAGLGHGWAATAHLAARAGRDVMLLGPVEAAPRLRSLVRASIEPERRAGLDRHRGLSR